MCLYGFLHKHTQTHTNRDELLEPILKNVTDELNEKLQVAAADRDFFEVLHTHTHSLSLSHPLSLAHTHTHTHSLAHA